MSSKLPSRKLGRRDILVGTIGVAVGGGTAAAITAAADASRTSNPRQPSPGEQLMVEHGVLKRILLAYRAINKRLSAGRPPAATTVTSAAQIISDYVEGFHEGLEEGYIFPRIRSQQPQLVDVLLEQHDRGRHLTAAIIQVSSGSLSKPTEQQQLQQLLTAFVDMYEPHEAWEDTVAYPALQAETDPVTLNRLADRFNELAVDQFGPDPLAQVLTRVAAVETSLGIHDLAAFTPPT